MSTQPKKTQLSNGLKVIFERNMSAKIVSLYIGVKIGSADETNQEAGICHLIEHMLFKGTTSYRTGDIASLVESRGGELNAYTSFDQTVYYINLPSQHLKQGLNILKEMVSLATFDAEELEREKEVVIEEIRRGKDNPGNVLGEALFKKAYGKHPYGRPIIGFMETVRSFSRKTVFNFYKKNYRASNMILGVCGHVSASTALKQIKDIFGSLPKQQPLKTTFYPYQAHRHLQQSTVSMNVAATLFDLAFPIPHFKHEDVPALDVLSHLLGESDTSLLEQNTKEKEQLVHSISTSSYTPKHPGVFTVSGLVDPQKLNPALRSIFKQIENMKSCLIDEDKLERTKLLAKSQVIYEKQTCEGTVRKWISYETVADDFRYDELYFRAIAKLTPHDIQKVAQKYLSQTQATCVVLHPHHTPVKVDPAIFKKRKPHTPTKYKKILNAFGASVYQLSNGLRVVTKENFRLPLIAIKTASHGGLRSETNQTNGLSTLIANVITKGTQNISQLTLAEKCEWLAGGISGYTGRNSFGLSSTFLSDKLEKALPLFAEVLLSPGFDEREIEKEKKIQLEAIKNRGDQLAQASHKLVMQRLFKGHPFQRHLLGERKSVQAITADDLRRHYTALIVPGNLVISCVGDFRTDHLLARLEEFFGHMKPTSFSVQHHQAPTPPRHRADLFERKKKHQTHISLGFLGTPLDNPDRFVLEIIHSILSGQGGRLFLNLRDKQSLAYTVTSSTIQGIETGYFGLYIATDPAKKQQAITGLFGEVARLCQEKVPAHELARAKNYLIGNHAIDHQKNGAIAGQLATNTLYNLNLSEFFEYAKFINRISRNDIMRVARKYLKHDHCVVGVVGP